MKLPKPFTALAIYLEGLQAGRKMDGLPRLEMLDELLNGAEAEVRNLEAVVPVLQVLLDQVDYTSGACSLTEMVGAVLPKQVIENARIALANLKE